MRLDATQPGTVIVHGSAAGFAQAIAAGRHQLTGDEPTDVGGTDTGPTPYDFLLAALGSCTSMTVAMYGPAQELAARGRDGATPALEGSRSRQ